MIYVSVRLYEQCVFVTYLCDIFMTYVISILQTTTSEDWGAYWYYGIVRFSNCAFHWNVLFTEVYDVLSIALIECFAKCAHSLPSLVTFLWSMWFLYYQVPQGRECFKILTSSFQCSWQNIDFIKITVYWVTTTPKLGREWEVYWYSIVSVFDHQWSQ